MKEYEALKLARSEREKAQEERFKSLNAQAMQSLFDQMTKIDQEPDSKQSQEYLKQMEEQARNTQTKRSNNILIKTMKRGGRTMVSKVELDSNGQPLSEEELLFRRKNVDFTKFVFPEINFVNY